MKRVLIETKFIKLGFLLLGHVNFLSEIGFQSSVFVARALFYFNQSIDNCLLILIYLKQSIVFNHSLLANQNQSIKLVCFASFYQNHCIDFLFWMLNDENLSIDWLIFLSNVRNQSIVKLLDYFFVLNHATTHYA